MTLWKACLWVYRSATTRLSSDRYAIRTRNLQVWNLTRYRCANRSKRQQRGRRRGTYENQPPEAGLSSHAFPLYSVLSRPEEVNDMTFLI